jgi:hypothetical protein
VAGDNFRVYYFEQAADYVVPETGALSTDANHPSLGAPVAGLTNDQAMQLYGIAIGGEVYYGNLTRDGI